MTQLGKPTFRQAKRADKEPERSWYPKYQEWLSLMEYEYYKQTESKETLNDKSNAASV